MNQSVERSIKGQYAHFFEEVYWRMFKEAADYYFETAAKILRKDIHYGREDVKLLRRNVTKRLYIEIGCELLLKAIYLKNGFCINRLKKNKKSQYPDSYLYKIADIDEKDFKDDDTLSLNQLIQKLFDIEDYGEEKGSIEKGLRISKVFRNKEGHVVSPSHEFKAQNYKDIAISLIGIYKNSFNEDLQLRFSVADSEQAIFNIKKIG